MTTLTMDRRIELELRGADQQKVTDLMLDNCNSGGMIEGLTDDFVSLERLSMINVKLTSLKNFPKLPQLQRLELSDNSIRMGLDVLTRQCPNLTHLNLSNNKISTIEALEPLKELAKLTHLDLFRNEVTRLANYREETFKMLSCLKSLDGFVGSSGDVENNSSPSEDEEEDGTDNEEDEDDDDDEDDDEDDAIVEEGDSDDDSDEDEDDEPNLDDEDDDLDDLDDDDDDDDEDDEDEDDEDEEEDNIEGSDNVGLDYLQKSYLGDDDEEEEDDYQPNEVEDVEDVEDLDEEDEEEDAQRGEKRKRDLDDEGDEDDD